MVMLCVCVEWMQVLIQVYICCVCCSAVFSGGVADALLCGSHHLAHCGSVSRRQSRFYSISHFHHFLWLVVL